MENQETVTHDWEEVGVGQWWKPQQPEEFIEGKYLSKNAVSGNFGTGSYTFDTTDGIKHVSETAVLKQRMSSVAIGKYVRVVYKGVEKNKKGQDIKIFKVYTKQIN